MAKAVDRPAVPVDGQVAVAADLQAAGIVGRTTIAEPARLQHLRDHLPSAGPRGPEIFHPFAKIGGRRSHPAGAFDGRSRRPQFETAAGIASRDCPRGCGLGIADPRLAHAERAKGERSEGNTPELQSLMRLTYALFCL